MFKNMARSKTIAATRTGPKIDRNRSEMGRPAVLLVVYVDIFASRD
jgi:hypothetical protein